MAADQSCRNAPDVIYLYFSLSRLPRMNSSIMVELGTLSLYVELGTEAGHHDRLYHWMGPHPVRQA